MSKTLLEVFSGKNDQTRTNRNNRLRGKAWERRVAEAVGGKRNLDKSRPHTDVENDTHVYEVKSTTSRVPAWIANAWRQGELASDESQKELGGIIKVWTGQRPARAFLIQEIDLES
tara:strand:+ start:1142 stop:1489 length:348 start_codon:yes stop_codon:yes gene_type:complete